MDVLLLGTEQAQALGLPARRLRLILLALAALLAGAAVSFSGLLGFVGLIVPHMMRQLVGEESGPSGGLRRRGGTPVRLICWQGCCWPPMDPWDCDVSGRRAFFLWLLGRRGARP
ncbi:MAG: iron chelate uptake ABC transporter family permease subunit [Dysosmobacter welbionis]